MHQFRTCGLQLLGRERFDLADEVIQITVGSP